MEYRELGRSGVHVSAISLGTMTFGEQNTEADGHAQMDYALDRGITSSTRPKSIRFPQARDPRAHRIHHRQLAFLAEGS